MYTGTTPTITLAFTDDISGATSVVVTFAVPLTRKVVLSKSDDELTFRTEDDTHYIDVFLSQEETLKMPKNVLVQVNFLFDGDRRSCSEIATVTFNKNLNEEVMTDAT